MTTRPRGDDRYRLWPAARPYVRMMVISFLPVPDLPGRLKVRRAPRSLVTCHPWPGMEATGTDAAQLAPAPPPAPAEGDPPGGALPPG